MDEVERRAVGAFAMAREREREAVVELRRDGALRERAIQRAFRRARAGDARDLLARAAAVVAERVDRAEDALRVSPRRDGDHVAEGPEVAGHVDAVPAERGDRRRGRDPREVRPRPHDPVVASPGRCLGGLHQRKARGGLGELRPRGRGVGVVVGRGDVAFVDRDRHGVELQGR